MEQAARATQSTERQGDVVLVVAGGRAGDAVVTALDREATGRGVRCVLTGPAEAEDVLRALVSEPGARVAVAGVGEGGDDAARAVTGEGAVVALALLGADLSAAAANDLAEWDELPVLALADPSDRPALRSAVDVFCGSRHTASDLAVGPLAGGAVSAARWLVDRLARVATAEEVVLRTDDGWDVHATRWLPAGDGPVPGVVLLHSGRSDRAVFTRLERLLAEAGMAVLNLDWRGRGQTTGRGTYFDLSAEERAAGWRDAAAAFEHLAGCDAVDGDRLGAVGVVHGAEHAARAAVHDARVRALAILTGYRPASEEEASHLTSGAVDVLYVTSADHRITTDAMRALYRRSSRPLTRYLEYPGGAIGYQLFELDADLEPQIVAWLQEVLAA